MDSCIRAFLKDYKKSSNLGGLLEGVYYWNEREAQWALFQHLRSRTVNWGIGSEWWVHAEGDVARPRYSRWRGGPRADIILVDHYNYRNWVANGEKGPPPMYHALIEMKLLWSGWGMKATLNGVKRDLSKLARSLQSGQTGEAHFVLLDALRKDRLPYYSRARIQQLLRGLRLRKKVASKLHVWHWPDSRRPITKVKEARWWEHTARV